MDKNLSFIRNSLNYYRELEIKKCLRENFFLGLALFLPLFLLAVSIENIFVFRIGMIFWIKFFFLSLAVFIIGKIYFTVWLIEKTSYDRIAIHLEKKFPHLDSRLINAWQLGENTAYPQAFINRLKESARKAIGNTNIAESINLKKTYLYRKITLVSLLALSVYALLSPTNFRNSLLRILVPSIDINRAVRVEPGDAVIEKGAPLTIKVYLNGAEVDPLIEIKNRETKTEKLLRERQLFSYYLPEVTQDFSYRIIYDRRKTTNWFKIMVKEQTLLRKLILTYDFPAYTKEKNKREEKSPGEISALYGTKITVESFFNNPVGDTYFILGSGNLLFNRGVSEKKTFQFTAKEATLYQFRYYDPLTKKFKETPRERLSIRFDSTPYVEFTAPGRDLTSEAGESITIKVKAKDDFGLTSVRVRQQRERGKLSPKDPVLYQKTILGKSKEALAETVIHLPAHFTEPLIYYAECTDNHPSGNTGFSSIYYIYPSSSRTRDRESDKNEFLKENLEEKVEILKNEMEKFISEEKKLINAAKKIMDSENKAGEENLDNLAEIQNKWLELFQKMVDDLDKMGTQTKGKFTLAEELVEMLSHLQVSGEHLAKKDIHLAIPESQTGLELAEEITSNLERWLSESPDHIKWDMEEPSAKYDVPEAELPEELEDIIGELIEQEEDMREEIEDITSSWMDSLDKGAGWGAADGPISNMSAKGITGNLMPNQQEIGGRSGEGRTGRSYGEMVEKTATGKGGRKTPARLTPDNIEPGEIKDTSGEQPSGPTGGGKASGWGTEGLTGPVQDIAFRYDLLSQKQQKLIEKTESLIRNMQIMNVYNPDIEKALGRMQKFQVSLKEGRYTELLTEKQRIISHLRQADQTFTKIKILRVENGERTGQSRTELGDIWDEKIPTGYENMVRKYYKEIYQRK
jgi:hypothetical protein